MKSLKEILETPLENIETLNEEELDIYAEAIMEAGPSFDYEKENVHVYKFQVKGLLYRVELTESIFPNSKKLIEVKFKLMNNPKAPRRTDFQTDQQYQIALRKSQVGLTGTGNPNAVFARVMGVIIESVKSIQPDYITFTAEENKRRDFYQKLIRFMRKYILITYNQIFINPLTGEQIGDEEFWLEKSMS